MNKYLRPVLMTLACGIGGGIVMALLLLYMMITTVFTTGGLGFVLELLVAAALPLCLNVVRKELADLGELLIDGVVDLVVYCNVFACNGNLHCDTSLN